MNRVLASLLFWPGVALVFPQALYVRRHALRFGAAEGEAHGSVGSGPPVSLLGLGDSIIEGVGAGTHQQGLVACVAAELALRRGHAVSWSALGKTGANAAGVRALFQQHLPPEPVDYVLVSVGVNDTTGLVSVPRWQRELHGLFADLRAHSPQARVLLCGLPPMQQSPLLPAPLSWLGGLRAWQLDDAARAVANHYPQLQHIPMQGKFGRAVCRGRLPPLCQHLR